MTEQEALNILNDATDGIGDWDDVLEAMEFGALAIKIVDRYHNGECELFTDEVPLERTFSILTWVSEPYTNDEFDTAISAGMNAIRFMRDSILAIDIEDEDDK